MFFHHSSMKGTSIEVLRVGQAITYEERRGPKGLRARYLQSHTWARFKARTVELARCAVLCRRLNRQIRRPQLRREYRRRLWRLLKTSADPLVLFVFFLKCTVHYHHYLMAEQMSEEKTPPMNPF